MKKKTKPIRILLILAVILVLALPSWFRFLESFELITLDIRFNLRPPQEENKDIAIIEISNDSLAKIGKWPFGRNWHAAIIDILSAYNARMIIFDTLFSEPSPFDERLIESTKRAGNVYYAFGFRMPKIQPASMIETDRIDTDILPGLKEAAKGHGFINVLPDVDGKTRRIPLRIKHKGRIYPHLALLTAADYLGRDYNKIEVPLDEKSRAFINFAGTWQETFKHYSYIDIIKSYQLISEGGSGVMNLNDLRDKVCFIGLTATGTHDLNPIPLQERYPGLGVHVSLFNTIATQNFLKRASRLINLSVLFLLSMLTILITSRTRPFVSFRSLILIIATLCISGIGLFIYANIWIDLFYPILALVTIYLVVIFYKYVTERDKRLLMDKELELAKRIQRSFLPKRSPTNSSCNIAAVMSPARQVGGDFYDFVELRDGRLGVMVGDVSGKGIGAALYMAKAVSLFRIFAKEALTTKDALIRLNKALTEEDTSGVFVTVSYLIYDAAKKSVIFSSGGHLPAIILKKGGNCRNIDVDKGLPLGIAESDFSQTEIPVSKGDIIVLYTDGVTEAKRRDGGEFGMERLKTIIETSGSKDAKGILNSIIDSVTSFSKSVQQHDDITAVVVEVK